MVLEDEEDDGKGKEKSEDSGGAAACEETGEDVFSPQGDAKTLNVTFAPESGANRGNVTVSVDMSTQTDTQAGKDDNDQDEWWNISKDVLYKFTPLPPSNCTTPSASHSNLENYQ